MALHGSAHCCQLYCLLLVYGMLIYKKSEKGFYAMSFVLSLFAAIAVQKNTRDIKASKPLNYFKHFFAVYV